MEKAVIIAYREVYLIANAHKIRGQFQEEWREVGFQCRLELRI